jgi:ATP/maltotriose-dependent transcriptional regulator MalT
MDRQGGVAAAGDTGLLGEGAAHWRVTVIVAPAGYGKTTAADRLSANWPYRGRCDADGVTTVSEFASRLLRALFDQTGSDTELLAQEALSTGRETLRTLEVARQAWQAGSESPSVLIFDRLERIEGVDGLRDYINELFVRPIPNRSAILCSRRPLAQRLTRFALPHEMATIGKDQLRIDRRSIADLLPQGTPDEIITEIERVTQGWIIAVLYLAREARTGTLVETLERLDRQPADRLDDYMTYEIYDELSAEERLALLGAVAVPEFSLSDAAALLEMSDAQTRSLLEATPFLAPIGYGGVGGAPIDARAVEASQWHADYEHSRSTRRALCCAR